MHIAEEIGKRYGSLIIQKFVSIHVTPNGKKFKVVECLCDCGNTKIIQINDLRCRKTKTCGDRQKHLRYEDRSIPAFNQLYRHTYMGRAKKKGLPFLLTENEFKYLTQQDCHYCGAPPTGNAMLRTGRYESIYTYNGLDRKDNMKGYEIDNIVPCCGICNHAKHTMSYDDFMSWISKLHIHQHQRGL